MSMKRYDSLLGRYPASAWDDEWLSQVRDGIVAEGKAADPKAPLAEFHRLNRAAALDHVEQEIWKREPYRFNAA